MLKYLAENRKSRFEYDILEKYEAGIILTGQEVKSVKLGRANISSSFVLIKPKGAFLLNTDIPPYQAKNSPTDYNPSRTRKLLLNNDEIKYLRGKTKEGNLTIMPLTMYNKGRRIKMELGLGRHKKKYDKREAIKKRETSRTIRRTLKS
ncbi:SsrA-binding protein SmpB [Candidatus Wolfebacteria bacterium]|nr:SsrA-binding protein SmpB [Candidatus Wolfebacteria bacterium]